MKGYVIDTDNGKVIPLEEFVNRIIESTLNEISGPVLKQWVKGPMLKAIANMERGNRDDTKDNDFDSDDCIHNFAGNSNQDIN